MNTELRKDCPMRHKNGNCMPAGGFCTAVNDPICEALHNAYDTGRRAADVVEVKHGKWEENKYAFCNVCPECGTIVDRSAIKWQSGELNYCPNCGVKMDGDSNV